MVMKLLLQAVILMSLSGCWSQIFLDGQPPGDASRTASSGIRKRIHVVASTTCGKQASGERYQIREGAGQEWIRRCASIQGFNYRPGNDYVLQIIEYPPTSTASVRLVFDKVIDERPHEQK